MTNFTSARLTFTPQSLADYDACAAMWADADTMRHISGTASTPEESWHRVVRNIGHWAAYGYGFWTLHERGGGAFAGICGFKQFRRDLDPALQALPEIGWIMAPAARGRGLATEAAQASLAWADRTWSASATVCMVNPANAASLKVAARCGYRQHAETRYAGTPVILLTRR